MEKETFISRFKGKISSVGKRGPAELLNNAIPFNSIDEWAYPSPNSSSYMPKKMEKLPVYESKTKDHPKTEITLEKTKVSSPSVAHNFRLPQTNVDTKPYTTIKFFGETCNEENKNTNIHHNGNPSSKNSSEQYKKKEPIEKLGSNSSKRGKSTTSNFTLQAYSKEVISSGGLGPNFSDEWEARKLKREKQETYAEMVKELNAERVKKNYLKVKLPENTQVEEKDWKQRRAAEFSKSIPKPAKKQIKAPPLVQIGSKYEKGCLDVLDSKHYVFQNLVNSIK